MPAFMGILPARLKVARVRMDFAYNRCPRQVGWTVQPDPDGPHTDFFPAPGGETRPQPAGRRILAARTAATPSSKAILAVVRSNLFDDVAEAVMVLHNFGKTRAKTCIGKHFSATLNSLFLSLLVS
jgi:hypothetical protein